ncbi:MBL fold metallo-hydrolase [Rossellomorea marisflavi]|uniref:MBL fold metallo-hydrolase n=1 Tax=Rossellomorea marisflavi TaxID=189381 RepID=UPI001EE1B371|nr:MBL fold metallo-hydrolase [Rossellomorea marisflavi]UKS66784.1 MBL fold metallo-hydrolase [Rossellomorea marisflavi]
MKLTVIGHWGGYPKAGEASSGYIVEHEGFRLLIDCGSGVLSRLQTHFPVSQLDAVILSHYHPDHVADIGVLQHALLIQSFLGTKKKLPVYGHREDEQGFRSLAYRDVMEGIEYKGDSSVSVGPFTISFVKTRHPAPCYAMRIEADGKVLYYTGDTSFTESLIPLAHQADLLLCECNFYGGMDGSGAGHMTSIDAGRLAHQAGATRLVLTHLPHFGNLQQLVEEAGTAFNGTIELAAMNKVWII